MTGRHWHIAALLTGVLLPLPAATLPQTAVEPRVLRGHTGVVSAVAFVGTRVVSGGMDGTLRVWHAGTGAPLRVIRPGGEVNVVALSKDGHYAAAGHGKRLSLMSLQTGRLIWTRELDGYAKGIAFAPDGRTVAAVSDGGSVLFFGKDGRRTAALRLNDAGSAVAYSPDGRWLAAAGRRIRLWPPGAQAGDTGRVLVGHRDVAYALAFAPDGTRLLSASLDHTARMWDMSTGTALDTLETAHPERVAINGRVREFPRQLPVTAAAYAPDGRISATAGADRAVHLWNPATGARVASLEGHTRAVTGLAFGSGDRLASSSADGTVRIWTIRP